MFLVTFNIMAPHYVLFFPPESQIKKTSVPFHNYSNMNEDLSIKKEIVLGYPSKNVSLEDERSQLHSRRKRFLSYPRYVEVMVTADAKMVHHHGQNLQHYVLTLMSIVSKLNVSFKFPKMFNIIVFSYLILKNVFPNSIWKGLVSMFKPKIIFHWNLAYMDI